jgi:uncharacterized damage-inducible protein DinB
LSTPIPTRPEATEYAAPYEAYVRLVPDGNIITLLGRQMDETLALLRDVPESVAETRHAPYTWSIKEVVGHIADCERIFAGRAFCFARGDTNELPGMDEHLYVRNARSDARSLPDLLDEYEAIRRSTRLFFQSLDEEAWLRSGVANGSAVTVRALASIIAGHERHHVNILRSRLSPS